MEHLAPNLTATPLPQDSVGLLDVNERLHGLAGRLKERQPEDVVEALKLVEEYKNILGDDDINANKKFERLQELLPGVKMEKISLDVGGMSVDELLKEMKKNIVVSIPAKNMMSLKEGEFSNSVKHLNLVIIDAHSFFPGFNTFRDVFDKAIKLGLKKCPLDVGPYLALNLIDHSVKNSIYVSMDMVLADQHTNTKCRFLIYRSESGNSLWLSNADRFSPDRDAFRQQVVFCLES